MPFDFYKVIHLTGLFMLFLSFGGAIVLAVALKKVQTSEILDPSFKRIKSLTSAFHGLGLLFILVSGFGMLARLGGGMVLPPWVHPKLLIWVLSGGALFLVKKKPQYSVLWYILALAMGVTAALFAINKPMF